jgi:hypothetical protein
VAVGLFRAPCSRDLRESTGNDEVTALSERALFAWTVDARNKRLTPVPPAALEECEDYSG